MTRASHISDENFSRNHTMHSQDYLNRISFLLIAYIIQSLLLK
jgi:hypothetical protein